MQGGDASHNAFAKLEKILQGEMTTINVPNYGVVGQG
jgi:hypothetical protein